MMKILLAEQHFAITEHANDVAIRIKNVFADEFGNTHFLGVAPMIVDRRKDRETILRTERIIVLAMPGRDMNRASACIHRDEVRGENHRRSWEQWMLRAETLELGAWERLHRFTGGLEPGREAKGINQFVCEHENFRDPLAPKFLHDVDLFWIDRDHEVRRQCPRCCRPDRDTRFPGELAGGNRKLDENGLIIALLIFYLGLGQRGLRSCAPKDRLFRF